MKLFLLLSLFTTTPALADLYMWKDAAGTAHYTNLPDIIPQRYRGKVKVLAMPGEKKNEQSAAAAPAQSQSAPAPSALPMPPPPPAQPAIPAPRIERKSRRSVDD